MIDVRQLVERFRELTAIDSVMNKEYEAVLDKMKLPDGKMIGLNKIPTDVAREYHDICDKKKLVSTEQEEIIGHLGWWMIENVDSLTLV